MKIRIPLGNMVSLSAASVKSVAKILEKLGYKPRESRTNGAIDRIWFSSDWNKYDAKAVFAAIQKIAPGAELSGSDDEHPSARIIRFMSGNNAFWIGYNDGSLLLRQLRGKKGIQQLRNEGGGF